MSEWDPELEELHFRETLAERMGGQEKVTRQHDRGKLDIRQRLDLLLDDDSFHEVGKIAGTASYDDDGKLVDLMGADHVIFGSDWPHIEGMPSPLDYLTEVKELDDDDRRLVMRDNTRSLTELRPA